MYTCGAHDLEEIDQFDTAAYTHVTHSTEHTLRNKLCDGTHSTEHIQYSIVLRYSTRTLSVIENRYPVVVCGQHHLGKIDEPNALGGDCRMCSLTAECVLLL